MNLLYMWVYINIKTLIYKSICIVYVDWWIYINIGKYRYEYMWKDICKNICICIYIYMYFFLRDEFKENGRMDVEYLCIGVFICYYLNYF